MVAASSKWGFFKLVDHGVPSEIVENMKARLNEMFDLPMEEKLKGARSATMPLGYCATNPDYGKNLPWAEILQLLQSPQQVLGFAKKAWTNGRLKSVIHRAVVNKEKSRLSIAYFLSPALSTIIDSPPELLKDPNTDPPINRKYVPFTWADFRKELLIQKRVIGKTALDRYLISP
ncbi:Gibberellin 20 oxidase 3 [Camellia lanceoleosa]|nr:Gibberellin 20 oxidase 3 [Camellia lanceoleosa]